MNPKRQADNIMYNDQTHPFSRKTWRNKARLNVCIAKDLVENYGGRKADYLKRLNHKLKMKIVDDASFCPGQFAKAA
jgi:hypothetical protein